MKQTPLSCAVIGAGIIGAAASYAAARRGADVTLFEQFTPGHDRGSSHGASRLFRTAYFEHADYVPLLRRSAEAWRALERESGETLLEMCGVFMTGPDDAALIEGTIRAAKEHELPLQLLSRAQTAARFPWFSIAPGWTSFIEPLAGFIFADRAHRAMLTAAQNAGAAICANAKVETIDLNAQGLTIETGGVRKTFDRIIVATGAYGASFLGLDQMLVRPLRKTLCWAEPGNDRFALGNGFLPFGVQQPDGRFFYGFPAIDGDGVKIGEHTGGAAIETPDAKSPDASDVARRDIAGFIKRRAPGLNATITKSQDCLYAMSPDGHFIIDRRPRDARIAFALGHSGHGFKFAPVIGDALADLVLEGETRREFDFLSLKRFS